MTMTSEMLPTGDRMVFDSHHVGDRMFTDIEETSVNGQAAIEGSDPDSFKYGYWRRSDGYITVMPNWPNEAVKFYAKGYSPLGQFGEFYPTELKEGWSFRLNKYHRIFSRGGAGLFCLEQILECGWLENPPIIRLENGRQVRVVFPQLEGITVKDLRDEQGDPKASIQISAGTVYIARCSVCHRWFLSTDEDKAKNNKVRHESVTHASTFEQQRYGEALVDALNKQKNSQPDNPLVPLMELMAKQIAQQGEALQALMSERKAQPESVGFASKP